MTRHEQFHIESFSMTRDILQKKDKSLSLMMLAETIRIPRGLAPEAAAAEFIAVVCEQHRLPERRRLERAHKGISGARKLVPQKEADPGPQWLLRAYDRHAPVLKALLLRMLGNEETAEAALLQLFVDLWHEPKALREDDDPLVLLVERARKQALKMAATGPSGDGKKSLTQQARRNGNEPQSALDRLAPRRRLLAEGVFFDGKRISDLAREEGVPCDWITSSLDRGLETLMRLCGPVATVPDPEAFGESSSMKERV